MRKRGGLMAPVHPGEILREDFMKPFWVDQKSGSEAAALQISTSQYYAGLGK